MASVTTVTAAAGRGGMSSKEMEGAEIITGAEECSNHSKEMMRALGFPEGMIPMRDLEECGLVRDTGFVWMKQKAPYEHLFRGTGTRVVWRRVVQRPCNLVRVLINCLKQLCVISSHRQRTGLWPTAGH
ncbi:hypothetical protein GUJ93_ZPchr0010g9452 [Zizania palustris]|uniref:Uncharacterized protein n=1 Tax=Zizania palustris TaxID=103762 RepID=A0A8J5TGZ9_ZIZPA|nr:hypothetical protein GUJ93_ZPchr0010g9452 [Zizania palustris]